MAKAYIDNFVFSPDTIERIKSLNYKLKREEERIRHFARELKLTLKKQVAEKQLDDFNFRTRFCVFSSDAACNIRHQVEEGDPIWEDKSYTMYRDEQEESFYEDNWNEHHWNELDLNEHHIPHPLGHLFFCYTMHCLVFHSDLSWQDIIDIDDVWLELKVDYQFFVENKKS